MLLLRIISLTLIYSVACLGAGWVGFKLLRVDTADRNLPKTYPLSFISSIFLLGILIFGCVWILLGLAGLFTPLIVWAITIPFLLLGLYSIKKELGESLAGSIRNAFSDFNNDPFIWKLIKTGSIFLVISFVSSIGSELTGDSAYFYMTMPKVLSSSHQLSPIPGKQIYETFGFVGEMHQAVLISMGSDDAARFFSFPVLLSCIFILSGIGKSVGLKHHGQWLTTLMLLSSSGVVWFFGEGKVDIFAIALALASVFCVLQGYPFLTGLFYGYAVLAKMPYLVVLSPLLGTIILWRQLLAPKLQTGKFAYQIFFSYCLFFLIGMVIPIIPHLTKNYIYYQELLPISSFATSGLFNWSGWDNTPYTKRIYLTFPLDITFNIRGVSPLVLCCLPLIFIQKKINKWYQSPLVVLTLAAAISLLCMVIVFPGMLFDVRFYLPALILFFPACASGAEYVSSNSSVLHGLRRAVELACLATITWSILWFSSSNVPIFEWAQTIRYLKGDIRECEKTGEYGVLQPRCRSMLILNQEAEPGARILTNAFHTYWLRSDLLQCANREFYQDKGSLEDAENSWREIQKQGYQYLLYDEDYSTVLQRLKITTPPRWVSLDLLYEDGPIKIYKLLFDSKSMGEAAYGCQKISPTAWGVLPK